MEAEKQLAEEEQMPEATTAESGKIKAIGKDTVHRICSGQVVLTLAVAVKELVENSIDAGATLVEVKLRDHGLEFVEVSDNGCGVLERDLEAMTAKYHTSKIRDFIDLRSVETFGFRGEALSSLCALSDLVVVTRHGSQDVGTHMELDHEGKIKKRTPCARSAGTTVTLTNLFVTLPVRRRDFVRNIRKEFNKMCQILQAYCLVTRGVRIICTNQTAKGNKLVVMQTNGSQEYLANIAAVFGNRLTTDLLPLKSIYSNGQELTEEILRAELQLEPGAADSMQITAEDIAQLKAAPFQLEGFVSSCSHGAGRSSKDRQYFYINSRPCEPKNIAKVVNDTYHRYNGQQYPFVFLNIITARSDVDVNLTPDKRQVLLNNEKILLLAIKKSLINTYGNIPSTYKLQNSTIVSMFKKENGNVTNGLNESTEESSESVPKSSSQRFMDVLSQWKTTGDTVGVASRVTTKRKCTDEIEVRTLKLKKIHEYLNRENLRQNAMPKEFSAKSDSEEDESDEVAKDTLNEQKSLDNSILDLERIGKESKEFDSLTDKTVKRIDCKVIRIKPEPTLHFVEKRTTSDFVDANSNNNDSNGDRADDDSMFAPHSSANTTVILDESIVDAESTANYYSCGIMRITLEEISQNIKAEEKLKARDRESKKARLERLRFQSEINPSQNQKAEEELQREITKDTFAKMEIIGQFNLGFIIVKLDTDLFIIDQHATDEKYNFEMLQRTTVLQSQPLAVPQPLELTVANEMLLLDNLPVFQKNGFKFEINENAPPTKKVKLLCKPSSQQWQFGKEDIDELIFMLQDAPAGTVCRPSRIRDMFASRACRKSVMIGTALKTATMKQLVTHMGEIEHPWCNIRLEAQVENLCGSN
ncbi:PREDICTED: mismatch repair endonuclease PMS2 isoform X2 [Rhagoletis zephyria]|uniref:mismatch repair endonuclease PMS2 isoform X2 n=1 Tax=Rhagoletis zephyria TaxID=28612 RepID=UPI000811719C|nr:PREDICTED: mismatch repair endonuclease PMS2 isoform X2 [Rhagoletis zephyria]